MKTTITFMRCSDESPISDKYAAMRWTNAQGKKRRFKRYTSYAQKVISGDAWPMPERCTQKQFKVHDIDELHDLLDRMRAKPKYFVIRGEFIEDTGEPQYRSTKSITGKPATIKEVPRSWLMIDVDGEPSESAKPKVWAKEVRRRLPVPFRHAACVWQASASAGRPSKPGIRIHIWFLLDRLVSSDQVKAWLQSSEIQVDTALGQTNQIHYTADPAGDAPSIGPRIGKLRGESRVCVPENLPELKKKRTASGKRVEIIDLKPRRKKHRDAPVSAEQAELEAFIARTCLNVPAGECTDTTNRVAASVGVHCARAAWNEGADPEEAQTAYADLFVPLIADLMDAQETATRGYTAQATTGLIWGFGQEWTRLRRGTIEALPEIKERALSQEQLTKVARKLKELRKLLLDEANASSWQRLVAEFAGRWVGTGAISAESMEQGLRTGPKIGLSEPLSEEALEAVERGMATPVTRAVKQTDLAVNEYGPERCASNVHTLMKRAQFSEFVAFDRRGMCVIVTAPPSWLEGQVDESSYPRQLAARDSINIMSALKEQHEYPWASTKEINVGLQGVALNDQVDPVAQYLDRLEWSGSKKRARKLCKRWLIKHAGAEDSIYTQAVSMRWLISAVQRVYEPGCLQRELLTLLGAQNIGKSTLLRSLVPVETLYKDDLIIGKDSAQSLLGKWIVEIAELDKYVRTDAQGHFKSFVSSRIDNYRGPYQEHFVDQPRSCILCATSNEDRLFRDATGATRFNVVHVSGSISALSSDARDELWSAARCLYRAGVQSFLTASEKELAAEKQEDARELSAAETWLQPLIEDEHAYNYEPLRDATLAPDQWVKVGKYKRLAWITSLQVYTYLKQNGLNYGLDLACSRALTALGCVKRQHVGNKHSGPRGWEMRGFA